jgi:hypothetical protein
LLYGNPNWDPGTIATAPTANSIVIQFISPPKKNRLTPCGAKRLFCKKSLGNVRSGSSENRTVTVTHLDRSEPNQVMFQVPAGYKVVDETPEH